MTGTYGEPANPSDLLVAEMVMKAWVNECGGSLALELSRELEAIARGESPPFNRERFDATSQLFKEAGLDASEHIAFRSKELISRCERTIWAAVNSCNQEWFLDIDERHGSPRPQFTPPNIARLQLEVEVTETYLKERRGGSQGSSPYTEKKKSINSDQAFKHEPIETEEKSTRSGGIRKGNLPAFTTRDITQTGLTGREVAKYLAERNPDPLNEDDIEILASKLSQAANRIASKLPEGKIDPPIRVQARAGSPWSFVALIEKGRGGRPKAGGEHKGNLYGLIRGICTSDEVNDES